MIESGLEQKLEMQYPLKKLSKGRLLGRYIFRVLPAVRTELQEWEHIARNCPNPVLREQALKSLEHKAFHCQGGAVFACSQPDYQDVLIKLIVAYQTICDYLDNLCDRASCYDGRAFRQIHEALFDALTPGSSRADYYVYYPSKDDGGYLNQLVLCCRKCLMQLPAYKQVYPYVRWLASEYIDLQVYKHIDPSSRESDLLKWACQHNQYADLKWQEYSAATGSTLAVFALFVLACQPQATEKDAHKVMNDYFPWICGLHILLDYLIDQEEDRIGGDLNFTFYYASQEEMIERFSLFIKQVKEGVCQAENADMAELILEGILAMYLSDPKVRQTGKKGLAYYLLRTAGRDTLRTYYLCKLVRFIAL